MADSPFPLLKKTPRIPFREILFCAFLAAATLLPHSPLVLRFPFRDSGVFLYTGWRMSEGQVPYRDVWDHKPPLIYFLNAAGLTLGNGSVWGVWAIEWVSLSAACLMAFRLLKKTFDPWAAGVSLLLMLGVFFLLVLGGNYTTEYALPLQFACLYAASGMREDRTEFWRMALLGILGACLFLLKQNLIGIPAVIAAFRMFSLSKGRRLPHAQREAGGMAAGIGLAILPLFAYFAANGALGDFWDAAFRFNFYYAESGLAANLKSAVHGVEAVSAAGFGILGLVGWSAGIWLLARAPEIFRKHGAWPAMAFAALPVEVLLAALPGRFEIHYYLGVLPVFCVFAALALWAIFRGTHFMEAPFLLRLAGAGILALALLSTAGTAILSRFSSYRANDWSAVVEFIDTHSSPDDPILFWGAESGLNFMAERRSPSKYVYQYPLYRNGYARPEDISGFLLELQASPPRWIIDTKNPQTPFLDIPLAGPETAALREWILLHYEKRQDINGWTFYEWKGTPD
jgi:hypothetical protein